jgi:hypothetical protein
MSSKGKRRLIAVGAVVVAAGVALILIGMLGRARICGATPDERITSICRLADTKPFGAGDALAEAAVKESDVRVRQAALVGLGRFVKPKYRATVERCTQDASSLVRGAAASTLGLYDDEAAAARLGEVVRGDPAAEVRLGAVVGLGRCAASETLAWLMEAAEKDDAPDVQYQAIKELYAKFGAQYFGKEPRRVPDWPQEAAASVEYLKSFPGVQEAFRKAGLGLARRPKYRYVPQCERDGYGVHQGSASERAGGAAGKEDAGHEP